MWTTKLTTFLTSSLQRKLMTAIIAVTIFVIGLGGIFLLNSQQQSASAGLEARVNYMANMLGKNLARPLWDMDTKSIQDQLEMVMSDPEIYSVALYEGGTKRLVASKKRDGRIVEGIEREVPVVYARDYTLPPVELGRLQVVYTSSYMYLALRQTRAMILAGFFALLVSISAATYILLRRMVQKPVGELLAMAQRIAEGDLEAGITITSRDEIGLLGEKFNYMTDKLKQTKEGLSRNEQDLRNLNEILNCANAELAQHRDNLEELVHARTLALAEARDAAESANRAKSAFLANMGHELRTPMNQIMGMGYLLASDIKDESAKEKVATINRASNNLFRLINDILSYAKMEADQIKIEDIDFDLIPMLHRAEEGIREMAVNKALKLITEVDTDLPTRLKGDPVHLRQILSHLLNNAVKFSDNGSITLRARQIKTHNEDVTVRFEVEDQGIGIAPEVQAGLFQLFNQGDGAATRKYEGTGLGLALCKRLVSLMAGEIGVITTPELGSTFWFSVRLTVGKSSSAVTTDTGPVDWKQVGAAMDYLERLLADSDMQSQTLWSESRQLLAPALQGKLEAFEKALEGFDFEAAQQLLREAVASTPQLHHS